jgi:hypothetical protein
VLAGSLWLPNAQGAGATGLDFSLLLTRNEMDLEHDTVTLPVTLKHLGIVVFETVDPHLQYGFLTGSSAFDVENDSATAGLSLSGYHLGIALRGHYGHNPQLQWQAHYVYQETRHKTEARTLSMNGFEWEGRADLRLGLGPRWALLLGGAYRGLDVERRATGDINETRSLELDESLEGRLGIELVSPPNGRVRLTLRRGAYHGLTLGFSRGF